MQKQSHIGIIGGGAAAVALAAHLARAAAQTGIAAPSITIFDPADVIGLGVAYATRDPAHVLNVPAAGMSLWPDQPNDFLDWLNTNPGWRVLDSSFEDMAVTPYSFMPRMVYGAYLRDHLARVNVTHQRAMVTNVVPQDAGLAVSYGDQTQVFDAVVLACGNVAPVRVPGMDVEPPAIPLYGLRPNDTPPDFTGENVMILGTGLSMVDAVLTLDRIGYDGQIMAVSRHGLLPQPHAPQMLTPRPPFVAVEALPATARAMMRALRRAARDGEWRTAVDSLRPFSNTIWRGLSLSERARLRRVLPYWAVHRHRMAPHVALRLQDLMGAGRLSIHHGRADYVRGDGNNGVIVGVGGVDHACDAVISALGYRSDPFAPGSLSATLVETGVLNVDGPAIRIYDDASLRLHAHAPLYGLGPVLGAAFIETTAMPDIRQQAAAIAATLLAQ
ncbi:FAD/NAD(P)-binding protein [Micavibrio aeruginosavorus]|uniref:FAD/NAD(P)-binding protein n=1 Tax=Micavibrio aeruginosavorus TaxID=349221 RepID=UPI003F4AD6FF